MQNARPTLFYVRARYHDLGQHTSGVRPTPLFDGWVGNIYRNAKVTAYLKSKQLLCIYPLRIIRFDFSNLAIFHSIFILSIENITFIFLSGFSIALMTHIQQARGAGPMLF